MKLTKLWTVLSGVFAFLLVAVIAGTNTALDNYGHINQFLGVTDTVYEQGENSGTEDTEYYKSHYGELSDANLEKLIDDAYEQVRNEAREGSVLLWNENALPLASDERSVTLFGYAAAHPLYVGGGKVSTLYNDAAITIDFRDALTEAGFSINETVYNALAAQSLTATTPVYGRPAGDYDETQDAPTFAEVPVSLYDESSWESNYNDVAIVVLSRNGGEGRDLVVDPFADEDGTMIHQLQLIKREKDMLKMIQDSGKFEKVVVLINCPWQLELEELKSYDVDAALWIGTPGVTGLTGVTEILTGKTNPSGRLVDTYAASALSAPAMANGIGNAPTYTNADQIISEIWQSNPYEGSGNGSITVTTVSVQQENIYIGYKYYETRYEDVILGRYNADGTAGAFASADGWNYADEVTYPFGYGLSYTTFSQKITDVSYDETSDMYTVSVEVTNTGDVAGKYAVPVYVQTPYGEHEVKYGIEKSAVNLVGYGKTGMLEPDASETVEVEVDRYLLASYDTNNAAGYIISEGTNYFAVGADVHDALNNILAAKGATGMVDFEGNPVAGNTDCVYEFETEYDDLSYKFSETGVRVTNQFEDNDVNYWLEDADKIEYLTRSDWQENFPTAPAQIEATPEMIDVLGSYTPGNELYLKTIPEDAPEVSDFNQSTSGIRIDNGLNFVDLRNFEYDDTVNWNKFLDQLTIEEMASLLSDENMGFAITDVALPSSLVADGIVGLGAAYQYGDGRQACLYTGQSILGATFNRDLVKNRGELMGEESLYTNCPTNWGIGPDLHRTPFSGRNWEYVSEDPNYTALVTYDLTVEMQEHGVIACPKHFANNDSEMWRNGISTFYTEQSFREGSLRGFEGSLRFGGALGTMVSMSRQGLVYSCSEEAMMTTVLRDEWGFKGRAVSDLCAGTFMHDFKSQVAAGTDQFCFSMNYDGDPNTGLSRPGYQVIERIEDGDGYMLAELRESAKHSLYALSRSLITNGLDSNTVVNHITPAWLQAVYAIDAIFAILTAGAVVMLTLDKFVFGKKKRNA